MKRVLVVGGAGYIGAHVTQALLDAGHLPVVLDSLFTGHRDLLPPNVPFMEGDIGDRALLERCFTDNAIDVVMHFAAFSQVAESVSSPLKYYDNNVGKTAILLAEMIRHDVRQIVFSSTAAVYGEPRSDRISEDHPLSPGNPYGTTKLAVERMLADCERAYGLRHVSFRYFNAAGADLQSRRGERHLPETHLIPLVLQAATGRRESIAVFGDDYPTPDGTCVRDYVHVADLAQAHLLGLDVLDMKTTPRVFNLGNEHGFSVREVIEVAREVTGLPIKDRVEPRRPGDASVLVADSSLARRELGWTPRYASPEDIITSAWNWEVAEAERDKLCRISTTR